MKIPLTLCQNPKVKPNSKDLGFGNYFSDHMFLVEYSEAKGWHDPRVIPYQNLSLDPAASVLHYGQALFEGMKAFLQKNGDVVLFRPEYNYARMQEGSERLCMEAPPAEMMKAGIEALVKADQSWVPSERGCALYLRPTLIGTESFLGVRPSKNYLFYVILSPVGAYYKEGLSPIAIWVEEKYVRAAPGGLGYTKAGANYASSLKAALDAKAKGYAQVLWLDVEHKYVEEVGTMNVFFVLGDEVVTPQLNGTILSGGVRDSVIQLLRSQGVKVTERKIEIAEVIEAHSKGLLKEAFGTGTAAVISPVGELFYQGKSHVINNKAIGPLSKKTYDTITGIQYGEIPDSFGWTQKI